MAGNRNKRTVSILSVLIITTTVAGFGQRRASYIVDPDIPRIEAGAEGGSISREIELGAAYLTGRGVARDEKQAARWYEKAANSGDPAAQEEIGYFYQAGIGVERDPARAAQWFERAVAGGLDWRRGKPGCRVRVGSWCAQGSRLCCSALSRGGEKG